MNDARRPTLKICPSPLAFPRTSSGGEGRRGSELACFSRNEMPLFSCVPASFYCVVFFHENFFPINLWFKLKICSVFRWIFSKKSVRKSVFFECFHLWLDDVKNFRREVKISECLCKTWCWDERFVKGNNNGVFSWLQHENHVVWWIARYVKFVAFPYWFFARSFHQVGRSVEIFMPADHFP